jgi:hypothetical protein
LGVQIRPLPLALRGNALLNLKCAIIASLLSQYSFMRGALRYTAESNSEMKSSLK